MRLEEILARVKEGTATAEELQAALPLLQTAAAGLSDWMDKTGCVLERAANEMSEAVANNVTRSPAGVLIQWEGSVEAPEEATCPRMLLRSRLVDAGMAFLTGEETGHVARQEAPRASAAVGPVYVHQEIAIDVTSHAWGLIKRVAAKDCDHGVGHDCREAAPGMPGNWCDPCLARILLEAKG